MNWLRTAGVEDVALRKESVDRNTHYIANNKLFQVALRKESVDRNAKRILGLQALYCRSPQGERG